MTLILDSLSIYKHVNHEPLFKNINARVEAGEVLAIMGASGCGKSTLLNAIAGHLSHDFYYSGEVILNLQKLNNIPVHQRQVGILFQDDLLFPHLSVWENLAFALPNSIKGKLRKAEALQALTKIKLVQLANHFPAQLSGGQRARISLIRMLVAKPKLVLLDEPFSKLDKALRSEFRDWVFQTIAEAKVPCILVTHDIDDVPLNGQLLSWRVAC